MYINKESKKNNINFILFIFLFILILLILTCLCIYCCGKKNNKINTEILPTEYYNSNCKCPTILTNNIKLKESENNYESINSNSTSNPIYNTDNNRLHKNELYSNNY